MQITKIDQIGIVVKDIQKTTEYYSSTLGIGPFRVSEISMANVDIRGKIGQLKIKVAITKIGPLQLELIENIEGNNIYTEFIKTKGEGLHHLAVIVDDVQKEVAELRRQGVRVLMEDKKYFAYLNTEETGGVILELLRKDALV